MIRVKGQEKPQVAPPAKSDSYAKDENGRKFRVQHREVAGTNFQIAGVDLTANEEVLTQAARIFGKVETLATGDASTFMERACYRSANEKDGTRIIFERDEVSPSFVLSSEISSWKWKTPCKRSPKISQILGTASGLHLGQTEEQVIAILGLPTRRSRNVKNGRDALVYELDVKRKMTPEEVAPFLKDELKLHPDLDQREYIREYGFYDLSEFIRAMFVDGKLTNLAIRWSEMY
jgi:hypothetical protein